MHELVEVDPIIEANEMGFAAGRSGAKNDNPWPPLSDMWLAYEYGYDAGAANKEPK